MLFTSRGTVEAFKVVKEDPRRAPSWWMILHCDPEIGRYYRWLLDHKYPIPPKFEMQRPVWKEHITIVRDEEPDPRNKALWYNWQGKEVTFTYTLPVSNLDEYFWLRVQCEELLNIRESLGLPRQPKFPLHLTIGQLPRYAIRYIEN